MSDLAFAPLASFAEVVMGQSPGADLCNSEERGLPFLQGCAEFGARHPNSDMYCSPPLRVAKAGSVLISVRAPVGTMNYADQDYCIGRGLGAFKAKSGVSSTVFLKHAVELNAAYLHRRSQGSTFAAVSTDDVRTVPIPVFKPQKQEKIASILTGIDNAIEKTQALIAKYQQIKAGLMHDLFTRGVLPNGQLRPRREQAPELYQETAIGWIPREWAVGSFGSFVEIIDPNPSHRYPIEVLEGVPICSTESFEGEDDFSFDKAKYVSYRSFVEQNNRCQFKPSDVVFARKGRIGLARRYGNDIKVFSHTVVILKPRSQAVNAEWLLWAARSPWFLGGIDRTMNSNSGVPTLGVEFISKVSVPFPSEGEQLLASEALDYSSARVSNLRLELEKLKTQKSGLMHDLLTGKVPVKVEAPEVGHG